MNKNIFWQYVRGISIIAVILIHTLYQTSSVYDYLNIVVRATINFSVATFLFMAGYFSKNEPVKIFYKKKFKRLLIPLIAWDVVYTGLAIVRENLSVVSILKNLVLLSDGYHLYYIYVLIQLFLITPFLYKYIKLGNKFFKFLPLAITPLYCLILELLQLKYNVKIPLYNYFLFGWFTYYYLGILIKNIYINKKKICSIGILLVFTLIVSILYRIVIFREFSNYSLATSQILFINVFYSSLVCIFLLSISKNQTKINKNSIIKKLVTIHLEFI